VICWIWHGFGPPGSVTTDIRHTATGSTLFQHYFFISLTSFRFLKFTRKVWCLEKFRGRVVKLHVVALFYSAILAAMIFVAEGGDLRSRLISEDYAGYVCTSTGFSFTWREALRCGLCRRLAPQLARSCVASARWCRQWCTGEARGPSRSLSLRAAAAIAEQLELVRRPAACLVTWSFEDAEGYVMMLGGRDIAPEAIFCGFPSGKEKAARQAPKRREA
jgi:hypothetical protein